MLFFVIIDRKIQWQKDTKILSGTYLCYYFLALSAVQFETLYLFEHLCGSNWNILNSLAHHLGLTKLNCLGFTSFRGRSLWLNLFEALFPVLLFLLSNRKLHIPIQFHISVKLRLLLNKVCVTSHREWWVLAMSLVVSLSLVDFLILLTHNNSKFKNL